MAAPSSEHAILEAAARWFVDLQAAPDCAPTREAHHLWLQASPAHQQAWVRLEKLQHKFGVLPGAIALPTLAGQRTRRRESLKLLGLLLLGGGTLGLTWQSTPLRTRLADHRTGTGEHHSLRLADGGQLELNTGTALDLRYDERLREVRLHAGEILVSVAADPRPFVVHTAQGSIQAADARFLVREEAGRTHVGVLQQALAVRLQDAVDRPLRVEAGQQLGFSAHAASPSNTLEAHADAWVRGMLIVSDWPLPRFINELARYRPGLLGCDPALAELRISGAFQLADSDAVLDNLSATLPLRIQRISRYWVRVEPA